MSRTKRVLLFCIPVVTIALIAGYVGTAYQFLDQRVEAIRIVFNGPIQQKDFVVYVSDSTDARSDFQRPLFAQQEDDSALSVEIGKGSKLRQLRLYFQRQLEDGAIREISLRGKNGETRLNLSRVAGNLVDIKLEENSLAFHVASGNGYAYIETRPFYYPEDYGLLLVSVLVAIGLSYLLYFFMLDVDAVVRLGSLTLAEWCVIAFILCISLPQVLFNVTLALSALMVIKNFRVANFMANKLNLIYLALFVVIFLNFLYFSSLDNFSYVDKYLSLLVLPIYAVSIGSRRLLMFFCVSAFLIGGTALVGAIVNISIFRNVEIISSDNLTGIIHPVYYSYLLAFSIIYIELGTDIRRKRLINLVLFVLLVLSGSKLILFGMLILSLFLFKSKVKVILVPLLVFALILFAPLRQNFNLVANMHDLSVLSEAHIEDPYDKRLNGFTLRVMLWQENLRIDRLSQVLVGNGFGPEGNAVLEGNLLRRGLTNHLWYNAHNQYLTTFFHTGILGLIALISILVYCIRWGVKSGDRVLILFTVLTALALMSESAFERVSGLVFFSLILLLITNSKQAEGKLTNGPDIVNKM